MTRSERLIKERKDQGIELIFLIPDIHFPFERTRALRAVNTAIDHFQPEHIVQMGDLIDAQSLTRFTAPPETKLGLQHELDQAESWWSHINTICPRAKKYQLGGNHEARLQTFLYNNPGLSSLRNLTFPQLINLDKYGVKYYPNKFRLGGLLLTHGNLVRNKAGYSATGEMEAVLVSGASGHVHRGALVFRTSEAGTTMWCECFHLSDLNKIDWLKEKIPDWQLGFAAVYAREGKDPQVVPIKIDDEDSFIMEGTLFTP